MDSPGATLIGRHGARYRLGVVVRETGDVVVWTASREPAGRDEGLLVAVSRGADRLFETEAVALTALQESISGSPLTATLDYGATPSGDPFAVIRLPSGDSLDRRLEEARGYGMPSPRVLHVGAQIVRALELLHARKLVHGDVRPSHVRLGADDAVTLLRYPQKVPVDGMRLLRKGRVVIGQSYSEMIYGAPEVHGGQPRTVRADVFGLASILFEMLSGAPPFPIRSPADRESPAQRIAFGPAPSLTNRMGALSAGLRDSERCVQRIDIELSRALHPEPDLRQASVGELWRGVEAFLIAASQVEPNVQPERPSLPDAIPAPPQERIVVVVPPPRKERVHIVIRPPPDVAGGWTWTSYAPHDRPRPIGSAAFDPTTGAAFALVDRAVWRYASGSWSHLYAVPPDVARAARAMTLLPNGHLLLAGDGGLAWRTSADGAGYAWPTRSEASFRACHFDPHDGLVTLVGVVRTQGLVVVLRGRDVLEHHVVSNTNALAGVTRLAGDGPRIACGERGVLVRIEEGITLHMGFPCNGDLLAIAPLPRPRGGAVVVGKGGHALHLDDTYATALEPVHTTKDILCCTVTDDGTAYAATRAGRVLRRAANGSAWNRIGATLSESLELIAVHAGPASVTALATDGTAVHGTSAPPVRP